MQPLTKMELEIPQGSGEVLCIPPAPEFSSVAQQNAVLLADAPLQFAGVPLRELRERVRRHVLEKAAAYTRALGIDPRRPEVDGLLFVTGHQPFLFHPGIWIKHLLVDRLASGGITALTMPVDSDAAEEIGADVPRMNAGLHRVRERLVQAAAEVPYEVISPPALGAWNEFLSRLAGHLRTLPEAEVLEVFQAFVRRTAALDGAPEIGTFLTMARRRYEGDRRYLELPVSRMADTPEFRQFVLHIIRDSERFADCYNKHLDAYRERYNIRTTAQPFPDLEVYGTRIELPFWLLQNGRRQPLFAERQPRSWRLWAEGESIATIPDGDGAEALDSMPVRPRALTLTAFTRLCLADLFVHGVGGGRYDRATDEVIREYFGIAPPAYAVVTATLHLPLAAFDAASERQPLQRRLLELQHNPDRILADPSSEQQALIEEKWRLIATLDRPGLTRRERRSATQRIREINELLSRTLEEERQVLERHLAALEGTTEATTAAATHRGYPFCFFPPRAIDELIDAMVPPETRPS